MNGAGVVLKTGHEDSSPRWEQPASERDAESANEVRHVPVPLSPSTPEPLATAEPRRDQWWRRVPFWTVVQAVVAALVLVGVSIAAVIVIRGPRVPAAVKVGPSIVLTLTPPANSTAMVTSTPLPPTAVPVLPGVIKFGGGGDTSVTQACNGTQPLSALNLFLDNSRSTVPVDWWVNVSQPTPDGKGPWAVAWLPYGTLPAGKSTSLTLIPAPKLCTLLAGGSAGVTFTADVDFGGVGGFRVTDIVIPGIGPTPTDTATATPTP